MRHSSIGIQRQLVKDGTGIGVLPDFMAADDPRFVRLLDNDVEINRNFWLVTHSDMTRLARIMPVSDLLHSQAANLLK